jgi:hypothetical protein
MDCEKLGSLQPYAAKLRTDGGPILSTDLNYHHVARTQIPDGLNYVSHYHCLSATWCARYLCGGDLPFHRYHGRILRRMNAPFRLPLAIMTPAKRSPEQQSFSLSNQFHLADTHHSRVRRLIKQSLSMFIIWRYTSSLFGRSILSRDLSQFAKFSINCLLKPFIPRVHLDPPTFILWLCGNV